MNLPQHYKSNCNSPSSCRAGCDPSLEPKSSHLSSPERSPISSSSLSIIAARSVMNPVVSSGYRDPLRIIHQSPRVAKTTSIHHRHTESLHRCMHDKSHETCANDDSHSPLTAPAFNHDNLVNAVKEPMQPHEHQRTYQRPSLSTGSTRLRSRSPPSPRMNSNVVIGTRRSTTINSGGPRNHSTNNEGRGERLPSLFAQLKAKLEAPRRPIIPTISTSPLSPPIRPISHYNHHYSSAQADEDYYQPTLPSSRSPPLYRHHPIDDKVEDSISIDRHRHYPTSDDGPWPPLSNRQSQPSLFGIPCSAAGQRAYSNHNDDTEKSFLRLQHEDNGRVEHRTIAFATHLSISRWEPVVSSTTPSSSSEAPRATDATAATSSNDELRANSDRSGYNKSKVNINSNGSDNNNCSPPSSFRGQVMSPSSASWSPRPTPTKQPQQQHRNSPLYTARLMSLANYIRHIISLTSGNSPFHSQPTLVQRQQEQQKQQKIQGCRPMPSYPSESVYKMSNGSSDDNDSGNSYRRTYHDSTSLPSPLSAGTGPGPIKSMVSFSSRKHRYSSEYHDHQTRRQIYHHPQHQQHRQGSQGDQTHRLPSPTSPTVYVPQQQQQQRLQGMGAASSPTLNSLTRPISPLLKVPYPNLTMTLALIYVDRLKAKYPEAKGEPGCSHRLFLVAYIIAAKYRCCVELAALLQEHENHVVELERRRSHNNHVYKHEYYKQGESYYHSSYHSNDLLDSAHNDLMERVLEARARAELILSNHEWVRLLCLGSFYRPPPPSPSPLQQQTSRPTASALGNAANAHARTSPSQPMIQPNSPTPSLVSPKSEPESLPIQSPSPCATVRSYSARNVNHSVLSAPAQVKQSLSSPSSPSPSPSSPQTPSSVFQVEDLDRMETEFLTFLNFDLSTRGQDLNTCWSLLVGNKDI